MNLNDIKISTVLFLNEINESNLEINFKTFSKSNFQDYCNSLLFQFKMSENSINNKKNDVRNLRGGFENIKIMS